MTPIGPAVGRSEAKICFRGHSRPLPFIVIHFSLSLGLSVQLVHGGTHLALVFHRSIFRTLHYGLLEPTFLVGR